MVSDFKILDCSLFQILIWYPILFCLYLVFLISYRNVFVLQRELWFSPFQWYMYQPFSMSVAGEIKQKLRLIFFWTPCTTYFLWFNWQKSRTPPWPYLTSGCLRLCGTDDCSVFSWVIMVVQFCEDYLLVACTCRCPTNYSYPISTKLSLYISVNHGFFRCFCI